MEIIFAIIFGVVMLMLTMTCLKVLRDNRYHDSYKELITNTLAESPDQFTYKLEYTDKYLKYLDGIIAPTCNIMFKEFMMGKKNKDNILRSMIQNLIADTATRVKESINLDNVDRKSLVITDGYFVWYITHVTMMGINKLFEESLVEIIEDT